MQTNTGNTRNTAPAAKLGGAVICGRGFDVWEQVAGAGEGSQKLAEFSS